MNISVKKSTEISLDKENSIEKVEETLLNDIAEIALAHFRAGFSNNGRGQVDGSSGWFLKSGKPTNLYINGHLLNSIEYKIEENTITIYINDNKAPYGYYHQYGIGKQTKKPILGHSTELNNQVTKLIKDKIKNIFS